MAVDLDLIYLRARYYDPSTGQFISHDPLTATTRQPYSYVSDNPLNGVDPTGLDGNGIYNFLSSTVGAVFGHQDYYSLDLGGNAPVIGPVGFGPTFGFTWTADKTYFNEGFGFGSSGPSCAFSGGHLLQRHASQAAIDNFVSGPSLTAGLSYPGGAAGVWGNEGQTNADAFGAQGTFGIRQFGIYQTNSVDTADPHFWDQVLGPLHPIDVS